MFKYSQGPAIYNESTSAIVCYTYKQGPMNRHSKAPSLSHDCEMTLPLIITVYYLHLQVCEE
jgi:hypothetical protein